MEESPLNGLCRVWSVSMINDHTRTEEKKKQKGDKITQAFIFQPNISVKRTVTSIDWSPKVGELLMVVDCVDINSCKITWDNVIKGIGNAFHSIECLIDVNFLQSSFFFQEKTSCCQMTML